MNHLVLFESFNSIGHINAIKDVFQDLIDDYDMDVRVDVSIPQPGYNLDIVWFDLNVIKLYLRKMVREDDTHVNLAKHNLDVSSEIRRLESIGYIVTDISNANEIPDEQIILLIDFSDV